MSNTGAAVPVQPTTQQQHPPPSPLSGCYLLVVLPEPHSAQHKDLILNRLAKGFLSWNKDSCHVDLEKELLALITQAPEGEEARNGEKLIQYATENLVTEVLIHPQINTLLQCIRNLLASFTKHRHIIHAGYTFGGNGSWILQDGTFSLADFLDAFSEHEVQRVLRAYENSVTVDIYCAGVGDWTTNRLSKEACCKLCRIRVNPDDVLTAGMSAITNFTNYIGQYLVPQTLDQLMESSDVVGNIRFSHPTLYVFPGGQGDAALFGINGFNMLVDGGFARKACFWDFTRHLDRLDAVLITRINNSNIGGIFSVLRKKKELHVYPQIGHFFCNLIERRQSNSPDGDKDIDPLILNLIDIGQEMMLNLRHINLRAHSCYRDSEPINLYHKVGHGTLDMYVLNPTKDNREVREFLSKWHASDSKLFAGFHKKDSNNFTFPIQNLISICALLVWQPANLEDNITRILFPGSTPQHKIFEGFERLKHLDFLKHPVCSAKTLLPSTSLATLRDKPIKKFSLIEKESKKISEPKKEKKELLEPKSIKAADETISKISQSTPIIPTSKSKTEIKIKKIVENKKIEIETKESKKIEKEWKEVKKESKKELVKKEKHEKQEDEIKKTDLIKPESDKTIFKEIKESKVKSEQKKKETKESKAVIKSELKKSEVPLKTKLNEKKAKLSGVEKKDVKSSPTTPKKILNGIVTKTEISKFTPKTKVASKVISSFPAKSAKEANNRKVVEQKKSEVEKLSAVKDTVASAVKMSVKPKPTDRKPISRRTKPVSPSKGRTSGSPAKSTRSTPTTSVKSEKDGVIRKVKGDKGTTDSSTVSTPSGIEPEVLKPIDKSLIEQSEDMSLDSIESKVLADLKEEREVVEEIEAVLQKAERIEEIRKDDRFEGDDEITAETTDKKEEDITEEDVTAEIEDIPKKKDFRKESQELTEEDEYLIVEKEEVYIEDSVQSGEGEQKHVLDEAESEKAKVIQDAEAVKEKGEKEEPEQKEKDENQENKIDKIAKKDKKEIELSSEHKEQLQKEVKEIIASAAEIVQKVEEKDDSIKKDSEEIMKEPFSLSPEKLDSSEKKIDSDMKPDINQKEHILEKREESQERISTIESGATTTAPTLPEDERIPLNEIKEDIDEKHVIEEVKEKDAPTKLKKEIVLETVSAISKPEVKIFDVRQAMQNLQRDIVKTPDEVADLPVHEEVDPKLYRMEDFEKGKEEKSSPTTQEIKELPTYLPLKEQKSVFSFFGKVADKFEKSIDKLTKKSKKESDKDSDEKSSSKSSSPKEIKIQEKTLLEEINVEKIFPKVNKFANKPEMFEEVKPMIIDVKVAAVKETAAFIQEEVFDVQRKSVSNIEDKCFIDKLEIKKAETEIKKILFTKDMSKSIDDKKIVKEFELLKEEDIEEDAEEVKALLEEASKKFKTVKDSLRDSLESLEEKIKEEKIQHDASSALKDTVKDTLEEVAEKLEEIKPHIENHLLDIKEPEKVKFVIPKDEELEEEYEEELKGSYRDMKEAVRDIGEVLAGTAGIDLEDKPKDVIEVVKKVAEVLKEDYFFSDKILFDQASKEKNLSILDTKKETLISTEKKLLIPNEKISQEKNIMLEKNESKLAQDIMTPTKKVDITEVFPVHKKVEEFIEKSGKLLTPCKQLSAVEIEDELCLKMITEKDDIITLPIKDITKDKRDTQKICVEMLKDNQHIYNQHKKLADENTYQVDVMQTGIENICAKKMAKQTSLKDKLAESDIEHPVISFEQKISPAKAEIVMVTPGSTPTSPKFTADKMYDKELKFREFSKLSEDIKQVLNREASVEEVIKELIITKKKKITIEVIDYITMIKRIPRERVIYIIEEIIMKIGMPRESIVDDSEYLKFKESITPEKKIEVENYILNEYIIKGKQITVEIVEEISINKIIPKKSIMEIIEDIIVKRKLARHMVLDISEEMLSEIIKEKLEEFLEESAQKQITSKIDIIAKQESIISDAQTKVEKESIISQKRAEIEEFIFNEYIIKEKKITASIINEISAKKAVPKKILIEIIEEIIIKKNIPKNILLDVAEEESDLLEISTIFKTTSENQEKKKILEIEDLKKKQKSIIKVFSAEISEIKEPKTPQERAEIEEFIVKEYVTKGDSINIQKLEEICNKKKMPKIIIIEIIEDIIIKRKIPKHILLEITEEELSRIIKEEIISESKVLAEKRKSDTEMLSLDEKKKISIELKKDKKENMLEHKINKEKLSLTSENDVIKEKKEVVDFVSIPRKSFDEKKEAISLIKTKILPVAIKKHEKDIIDNFEAVEQEYKVCDIPITPSKKTDEIKEKEDIKETAKDTISEVIEVDEKFMQEIKEKMKKEEPLIDVLKDNKLDDKKFEEPEASEILEIIDTTEKYLDEAKEKTDDIFLKEKSLIEKADKLKDISIKSIPDKDFVLLNKNLLHSDVNIPKKDSISKKSVLEKKDKIISKHSLEKSAIDICNSQDFENNMEKLELYKSKDFKIQNKLIDNKPKTPEKSENITKLKSLIDKEDLKMPDKIIAEKDILYLSEEQKKSKSFIKDAREIEKVKILTEEIVKKIEKPESYKNEKKDVLNISNEKSYNKNVSPDSEKEEKKDKSRFPSNINELVNKEIFETEEKSKIKESINKSKSSSITDKKSQQDIKSPDKFFNILNDKIKEKKTDEPELLDTIEKEIISEKLPIFKDKYYNEMGPIDETKSLSSISDKFDKKKEVECLNSPFIATDKLDLQDMMKHYLEKQKSSIFDRPEWPKDIDKTEEQDKNRSPSIVSDKSDSKKISSRSPSISTETIDFKDMDLSIKRTQLPSVVSDKDDKLEQFSILKSFIDKTEVPIHAQKFPQFNETSPKNTMQSLLDKSRSSSVTSIIGEFEGSILKEKSPTKEFVNQSKSLSPIKQKLNIGEKEQFEKSRLPTIIGEQYISEEIKKSPSIVEEKLKDLSQESIKKFKSPSVSSIIIDKKKSADHSKSSNIVDEEPNFKNIVEHLHDKSRFSSIKSTTEEQKEPIDLSKTSNIEGEKLNLKDISLLFDKSKLLITNMTDIQKELSDSKLLNIADKKLKNVTETVTDKSRSLSIIAKENKELFDRSKSPSIIDKESELIVLEQINEKSKLLNVKNDFKELGKQSTSMCIIKTQSEEKNFANKSMSASDVNIITEQTEMIDDSILSSVVDEKPDLKDIVQQQIEKISSDKYRSINVMNNLQKSEKQLESSSIAEEKSEEKKITDKSEANNVVSITSKPKKTIDCSKSRSVNDEKQELKDIAKQQIETLQSDKSRSTSAIDDLQEFDEQSKLPSIVEHKIDEKKTTVDKSRYDNIVSITSEQKEIINCSKSLVDVKKSDLEDIAEQQTEKLTSKKFKSSSATNDLQKFKQQLKLPQNIAEDKSNEKEPIIDESKYSKSTSVSGQKSHLQDVEKQQIKKLQSDKSRSPSVISNLQEVKDQSKSPSSAEDKSNDKKPTIDKCRSASVASITSEQETIDHFKLLNIDGEKSNLKDIEKQQIDKLPSDKSRSFGMMSDSQKFEERSKSPSITEDKSDDRELTIVESKSVSVVSVRSKQDTIDRSKSLSMDNEKYLKDVEEQQIDTLQSDKSRSPSVMSDLQEVKDRLKSPSPVEDKSNDKKPTIDTFKFANVVNIKSEQETTDRSKLLSVDEEKPDLKDIVEQQFEKIPSDKSRSPSMMSDSQKSKERSKSPSIAENKSNDKELTIDKFRSVSVVSIRSEQDTIERSESPSVDDENSYLKDVEEQQIDKLQSDKFKSPSVMSDLQDVKDRSKSLSPAEDKPNDKETIIDKSRSASVVSIRSEQGTVDRSKSPSIEGDKLDLMDVEEQQIDKLLSDKSRSYSVMSDLQDVKDRSKSPSFSEDTSKDKETRIDKSRTASVASITSEQETIDHFKLLSVDDKKSNLKDIEEQQIDKLPSDKFRSLGMMSDSQKFEEQSKSPSSTEDNSNDIKSTIDTFKVTNVMSIRSEQETIDHSKLLSVEEKPDLKDIVEQQIEKIPSVKSKSPSVMSDSQKSEERSKSPSIAEDKLDDRELTIDKLRSVSVVSIRSEQDTFERSESPSVDHENSYLKDVEEQQIDNIQSDKFKSPSVMSDLQDVKDRSKSPSPAEDKPNDKETIIDKSRSASVVSIRSEQGTVDRSKSPSVESDKLDLMDVEEQQIDKLLSDKSRSYSVMSDLQDVKDRSKSPSFSEDTSNDKETRIDKSRSASVASITSEQETIDHFELLSVDDKKSDLKDIEEQQIDKLPSDKFRSLGMMSDSQKFEEQSKSPSSTEDKLDDRELTIDEFKSVNVVSVRSEQDTIDCSKSLSMDDEKYLKDVEEQHIDNLQNDKSRSPSVMSDLQEVKDQIKSPSPAEDKSNEKKPTIDTFKLANVMSIRSEQETIDRSKLLSVEEKLDLKDIAEQQIEKIPSDKFRSPSMMSDSQKSEEQSKSPSIAENKSDDTELTIDKFISVSVVSVRNGQDTIERPQSPSVDDENSYLKNVEEQQIDKLHSDKSRSASVMSDLQDVKDRSKSPSPAEDKSNEKKPTIDTFKLANVMSIRSEQETIDRSKLLSVEEKLDLKDIAEQQIEKISSDKFRSPSMMSDSQKSEEQSKSPSIAENKSDDTELTIDKFISVSVVSVRNEQDTIERPQSPSVDDENSYLKNVEEQQIDKLHSDKSRSASVMSDLQDVKDRSKSPSPAEDKPNDKETIIDKSRSASVASITGEQETIDHFELLSVDGEKSNLKNNEKQQIDKLPSDKSRSLGMRNDSQKFEERSQSPSITEDKSDDRELTIDEFKTVSVVSIRSEQDTIDRSKSLSMDDKKYLKNIQEQQIDKLPSDKFRSFGMMSDSQKFEEQSKSPSSTEDNSNDIKPTIDTFKVTNVMSIRSEQETIDHSKLLSVEEKPDLKDIVEQQIEKIPSVKSKSPSVMSDSQKSEERSKSPSIAEDKLDDRELTIDKLRSVSVVSIRSEQDTFERSESPSVDHENSYLKDVEEQQIDNIQSDKFKSPSVMSDLQDVKDRSKSPSPAEDKPNDKETIIDKSRSASVLSIRSEQGTVDRSKSPSVEGDKLDLMDVEEQQIDKLLSDKSQSYSVMSDLQDVKDRSKSPSFSEDTSNDKETRIDKSRSASVASITSEQETIDHFELLSVGDKKSDLKDIEEQQIDKLPSDKFRSLGMMSDSQKFEEQSKSPSSTEDKSDDRELTIDEFKSVNVVSVRNEQDTIERPQSPSDVDDENSNLKNVEEQQIDKLHSDKSRSPSVMSDLQDVKDRSKLPSPAEDKSNDKETRLDKSRSASVASITSEQEAIDHFELLSVDGEKSNLKNNEKQQIDKLPTDKSRSLGMRNDSQKFEERSKSPSITEDKSDNRELTIDEFKTVSVVSIRSEQDTIDRSKSLSMDDKKYLKDIQEQQINKLQSDNFRSPSVMSNLREVKDRLKSSSPAEDNSNDKKPTIDTFKLTNVMSIRSEQETIDHSKLFSVEEKPDLKDIVEQQIEKIPSVKSKSPSVMSDSQKSEERSKSPSIAEDKLDDRELTIDKLRSVSVVSIRSEQDTFERSESLSVDDENSYLKDVEEQQIDNIQSDKLKSPSVMSALQDVKDRSKSPSPAEDKPNDKKTIKDKFRSASVVNIRSEQETVDRSKLLSVEGDKLDLMDVEEQQIDKLLSDKFRSYSVMSDIQETKERLKSSSPAVDKSNDKETRIDKSRSASVASITSEQETIDHFKLLSVDGEKLDLKDIEKQKIDKLPSNKSKSLGMISDSQKFEGQSKSPNSTENESDDRELTIDESKSVNVVSVRSEQDTIDRSKSLSLDDEKYLKDVEEQQIDNLQSDKSRSPSVMNDLQEVKDRLKSPSPAEGKSNDKKPTIDTFKFANVVSIRSEQETIDCSKLLSVEKKPDLKDIAEQQIEKITSDKSRSPSMMNDSLKSEKRSKSPSIAEDKSDDRELTIDNFRSVNVVNVKSEQDTIERSQSTSVDDKNSYLKDVEEQQIDKLHSDKSRSSSVMSDLQDVKDRSKSPSFSEDTSNDKETRIDKSRSASVASITSEQETIDHFKLLSVDGEKSDLKDIEKQQIDKLQSNKSKTPSVISDLREVKDRLKSSSSAEDKSNDKKPTVDTFKFANVVSIRSEQETIDCSKLLSVEKKLDLKDIAEQQVEKVPSDKSRLPSMMSDLQKSEERSKSPSIAEDKSDDKELTIDKFRSVSVVSVSSEQDTIERFKSPSVDDENSYLKDVEEQQIDKLQSDKSRVPSVISDLQDVKDRSKSPSPAEDKSNDKEMTIDKSRSASVISIRSEQGTVDRSKSPSVEGNKLDLMDVEEQQIGKLLCNKSKSFSVVSNLQESKEQLNSSTIAENKSNDKEPTIDTFKLANVVNIKNEQETIDRFKLLSVEEKLDLKDIAEQQIEKISSDKSISPSTMSDLQKSEERSKSPSIAEDKSDDRELTIDKFRSVSVVSVSSEQDTIERFKSPSVDDEKDKHKNLPKEKISPATSPEMIQKEMRKFHKKQCADYRERDIMQSRIIEKLDDEEENIVKVTVEKKAKIEEYILEEYIIKKKKISLIVIEKLVMMYSVPQFIVMEIIEDIINRQNMPKNAVFDFIDDKSSESQCGKETAALPSQKKADIEKYIIEEFIAKKKKITPEILKEIATSKDLSQYVIITIIEEIIMTKHISRNTLIESNLEELKRKSSDIKKRDKSIVSTDMYLKQTSVTPEYLVTQEKLNDTIKGKSLDGKAFSTDNPQDVKTFSANPNFNSKPIFSDKSIQDRLSPFRWKPHIDEEILILEDKRTKIKNFLEEEYIKKGHRITKMILEEIIIRTSLPKYIILEIVEEIILKRKILRESIIDVQIYQEEEPEKNYDKTVDYNKMKDVDHKLSHDIRKSSIEYRLSGIYEEADKQQLNKSDYLMDYESQFHEAFVDDMTEMRTTHITTCLSGKSTPEFTTHDVTSKSEVEATDKAKKLSKSVLTTTHITDIEDTMQPIQTVMILRESKITEPHLSAETPKKYDTKYEVIDKDKPKKEIEILKKDQSSNDIMKIATREIFEQEKAATETSDESTTQLDNNVIVVKKIIKREIVEPQEKSEFGRIETKETKWLNIEQDESEAITKIINREIIEHDKPKVIIKAFEREIIEQDKPKTTKIRHDIIVPDKEINDFKEDPSKYIKTKTTKTIMESEKLPDAKFLQIDSFKIYTDPISSTTYRVMSDENTSDATSNADMKQIVTTVTTDLNGKVITKKNMKENTDIINSKPGISSPDTKIYFEKSTPDFKQKDKFESTKEHLGADKFEHTVSSLVRDLISDDKSYSGKSSPDISLHKDIVFSGSTDKSTPEILMSPLIRDGTVIQPHLSGRSILDQKSDNQSLIDTPERFRSGEMVRTIITTTKMISDEGEIVTTTKEITETTNEKGETIVLAEKTAVKVDEHLPNKDAAESAINSIIGNIKSLELQQSKSGSLTFDGAINDKADCDLSSKCNSKVVTQIQSGSKEQHTFSDDEPPCLPLSLTSQVGYSPQTIRHYIKEPFFDKEKEQKKQVEFSTTAMSSSFYGELPTQMSAMKTFHGEISVLKSSDSIPIHDHFMVEKEFADGYDKKPDAEKYIDEADLNFEKVLEHKELKESNDAFSRDIAPRCTNGSFQCKDDAKSHLSSSFQNDKNNSKNDLKKDLLEGWGTPLDLPSPKPPRKFNLKSSDQGCLNKSTSDILNFDVLKNWGEPLKLPSPAGIINEISNKGVPSTPKKERKQAKKVQSENIKNKKRSESPSGKNEKKLKDSKNKIQTIYMDLAYVPHHGNSFYTSLDFFKRVRARYYVFSGTEPSREVYDALLEAKKTWEDKDLEVTMIPTYDTDTLGYWVADNEEALAANRIDLSPSASRCTINLQDHETSCSAYRLEF